MSPLARLILTVMRYTALAAAAFVAWVIGLQVWTHWGGVPWSRQDVSFMVVLVLLLAGALWLARSVASELRKSGS